MKRYVRDRRSPKPSSKIASQVMSSIRARNTRPELTLRQMLRANGFTGYRLHAQVDGRPDIVFKARKFAIFVHGCYWHRCPKCNLPLPKSNTVFWKNKFEKNVERDRKKTKALKDQGWSVVAVWECEIKKSPIRVMGRLRKFLR